MVHSMICMSGQPGWMEEMILELTPIAEDSEAFVEYRKHQIGQIQISNETLLCFIIYVMKHCEMKTLHFCSHSF